MKPPAETRRSMPPPLPESDLLLLDEAFERALSSWEEGGDLSASELFPDRPDLAEHAERIIALAQEVAVTGPAPAPAPSVPGYTVLSELGRGAMGAVYLARQEKLGGRPVALKVLPAGAAASARARDRFQAEANAVARLRHPHIVTVYDVVREGTLLAFAMEPVDGPSLADIIDHLAAQGKPPGASDVTSFLGGGDSALAEAPYWTFIARLGAAIARALEAVHRAGLLHRDVKPSNILLRRDGTPLLSDFGLVRDPESGLATRDGFVGTVAYASPEQLAGGSNAADARSDVYALGATLFHALALRKPFEGRSPVEVLRRAEAGPPPLHLLCPGVPRDLCTIITKAMAADRSERYVTAPGLASDLTALLEHRPITARPRSTIYQCSRFLRRNRALSLGAALALGAVGLGARAAWLGAREAARARSDARVAQSLSRFNEYSSAVQTAQSAIARGDHSGASAILASAPREFRAWEWRFLSALCEPLGRPASDAGGRHEIQFEMLIGHATYRPYSIDRTQNTIQMVDTDTRELTPGFNGSPAGNPWRSAFSTDGRYFVIAGAGPEGGLRVFDRAEGRLLSERYGYVFEDRGFGLTRDGTRVAIGGASGVVRIFTVPDLTLVVEFTDEPRLAHAVFSPDGALLCIAGDTHVVTFRRAADGAIVSRTSEVPFDLGWPAFSPDASRLYAIATGRQSLIVIDTGSARIEREVAVPGVPYCLTVFPDGRRVLVGCQDGTIHFFPTDPPPGVPWTPVLSLREKSAGVNGAYISPDSRRVFVDLTTEADFVWDAGAER